MDPKVQDIADWLTGQAAALRIQAAPHPELVRWDQNCVCMPVRIEGKMGVFRKAELLQELERRWEKEHGGGNTRLLLIPAAE